MTTRETTDLVCALITWDPAARTREEALDAVRRMVEAEGEAFGGVEADGTDEPGEIFGNLRVSDGLLARIEDAHDGAWEPELDGVRISVETP